MDNKKLLGLKIKELRKKANFTQEELAELIDIETGSLSSIESGRRYPSIQTLEKISQILNVNMKTLFNFEYLDDSKEIKRKIIDKIEAMDNSTIALLYKLIDVL